MTGPTFVHVNGVDLALWERPGTEPTILFCHATGFHARCWDQVIARVPGRRCLAIDMRGHGRSGKPAPPYRWRSFGEDLSEVVRVIGLRGALAVGHSMGGHAAVLATANVPEAFAGLLLLDPVLLTRGYYSDEPRPAHFARKRHNTWTSWQEMFERFRERPPFAQWDAAVLRDYCEFGLLPAPDGNGFVLACPPEVEASVYEHTSESDADIYGEASRVDVPVEVIRSARQMGREPTPLDMGASPTAPDLASHFKRGRDLKTEYSHFLPMEAPAFVAERIQSSLKV
jgi:pimeloyl-ACP methyl ester carboxylesterase